MRINFDQLIEGWRNHLIPPERLKKAIKRISTRRMAICSICEFNSRNLKDYHSIRPDEHCTICGCTLIAKTKCISCCCPMGYWTAVVSEEEEKEIKNEEQ
jgi:hypothetical protein